MSHFLTFVVPLPAHFGSRIYNRDAGYVTCAGRRSEYGLGMISLLAPRSARRAAAAALLTCLASGLAGCTTAGPTGPARNGAGSPPAPSRSSASAVAAPRPTGPRAPPPAPAALVPFTGPGSAGGWQPAGRLVDGMPAVYEATIVPPGAVLRSGVAWMDTKLLSARLYSGSVSPGGLGYKFAA